MSTVKRPMSMQRVSGLISWPSAHSKLHHPRLSYLCGDGEAGERVCQGRAADTGREGCVCSPAVEDDAIGKPRREQRREHLVCIYDIER